MEKKEVKEIEKTTEDLKSELEKLRNSELTKALEEIQIIVINPNDGYITLNGIFNFNIGDQINILPLPGQNTEYLIGDYTIINIDTDLLNSYTNIYINFNLDNSIIYDINTTPVETKMRIVSKFRNVNWMSGIWTNGIFETGKWNGGMWYNGIFGESAKWG